MKQVINNLQLDNKKVSKLLFIVSLFFSLLIGILLSYNLDFTSNYNLLFESDTSRVIWDISEFIGPHYRASVHPLFVLFMQPIYFFIKTIVVNKMLTIIVLSSIASSLSVVFIYKILSLFTDNIKLKIVVSLCYLFSFSNYVFTASIEVYNFATLFLIILWYFFIKKYKENNFDRKFYIIIVLLGIASIGFTITNFVIFLIVLFILLITKKVKFYKIIGIALMVIISTIYLSYAQYLIWPETPFILKNDLTKENTYIDYNINQQKINNVINYDFYKPILSSNLDIEVTSGYQYTYNNYMLVFKDNNFINNVVTTLFYLMLLVLLIRNFKKELFINIGLTIALLFNIVLHTIYGNTESFLYSMHFIYLIFIILRINLVNEKNINIKKICIIFLTILFLLEIVNNTKVFFQIIDITKHILNSNYYFANLGYICIVLAILLISCVFYIIRIGIKNIKKYKNDNKQSYLIKFISCSLLIEVIFIMLEIPLKLNIPWLPNKSGEVSEEQRINYLYSDLEKKYPNEIITLKEYTNEYNTFLRRYTPLKNDKLNDSTYYFFGMGNRKKLVFLENGLLDLDSNNYLYQFDVKDYKIIPNIYTVIIETFNGEYIKIYEDNLGVHYNTNDIDIIIEGTDSYIDLYDFNNQEYSNIKKVLYSEILFNIKDSVIYPNILVYNKPWYRDAALASMVLKQTNNTNLISPWVSNITEIYDYQNNNMAEVDNLGELLYIISTQEEYNNDLIAKIEVEAKRLASVNPEGYYLNGYTDFSIKPLYQNLWYKLGIESIGGVFEFDISSISDEYGVLTWWSNHNRDIKYHKYTSYDFPYLQMASYHKLEKGKFVVNKDLYPLSWEANASEANYQNMHILDDYYVKSRISPTHVWAASEMLLFLLDETGDLTIF